MRKEPDKVRISTRNMLLLLFVLTLIIPYGTTSLYFMLNMQQQMRINASTEVHSNMEMLVGALDDMLLSAERVSYLHLVDNSISSILKKVRSSYDAQYFSDERIMQNAIMHASSMNCDIMSVTFTSLTGETYCLNQIAENKYAHHDEWLSEAISSDNHLYIAPIQRTGSGQTYMPLVFALYDSQCTNLVGFVQIDYNIVACLSRAAHNLTDNIHVAIWQEDNPIFSTREDVTRTELECTKTPIAWHHHVVSGLTLAVYHTNSPAWMPIMRNIYLYLGTLALMILLAICLGWFALDSVGKSINQLSQALGGVKHGMHELIDIPKNSIIGKELNGLMHSYNDLIQRLTKTTQQEFEMRLEQQRAMMKALENQVNPHFLYNSLNLIASLIQLEETETTYTLALNLADVMRYCIKGSSMVTLEEDLIQTRKYIFIMETRFPKRLCVSMDVDPTLTDAIVPKFLLQPLIENSVIHGLDSPVPLLHVNISIRRNAHGLTMFVEDNGPGIKPTKYAALMERIEHFNATGITRDDPNASIGLFNVHARVRARYGESYGITIETQPGACRISVCMPYHRSPTNFNAH